MAKSVCDGNLIVLVMGNPFVNEKLTNLIYFHLVHRRYRMSREAGGEPSSENASTMNVSMV